MIDQLRPRTFDELVGQKEVVEHLRLIVESSKISGNPPGHILFLGPAGSGKSTMAGVFANESNRKIKSISAARMDKWDKILGTITQLEYGDVLFIDEIHALTHKIQENLYDVMEDFKADIFVGPPRNSRPITVNIPRFTLIGATTHAGDLNGPLLRRFDHKPMLSPYTYGELQEMVYLASNRIYEVNCPEEIAVQISRLSRRSAAAAYSLLKSYKEIEIVMNDHTPMDILNKTIRLKKLDPWIGLDYSSRMYLAALVEKGDHPIGIERMSSLISEQVDTIKWVIEPFLLSTIELEGQHGQMVEIDRTGRKATELAEYYVFLCKWHQETQGYFPGEYFG
jgi:Holliday junction DNA helicase RuvB